MSETEKKEKTPTILKKIGAMTYKVKVHFNEQASENLQEKMERIIREEVKNPSQKEE